MTKEQKTAIEEMRRSGSNPAAIASKLGMNREAVKKYCQRHPLTAHTSSIEKQEERKEPDAPQCRQCGKGLPIVHGRKQPKFCCEACRRSWWKGHPEAGSRKAYYKITCSGCGLEFTAYGNANRLYCSHSCYIASRFKRGVDHE